MPDQVDDLRLFFRVLDTGSISAAARSLDVSVAVASQRLKRLETSLGVRLLHRTTRRLHATPEGLALAEQGRALVEDLEALTGSLRRGGDAVAGTLRVTMSASFGQQHVSPLLPAFLARHPALRIAVNLDDRVTDLVGSGFDLAVRIGTLDDSSLVARHLAPNRRVLCASPGYLAARGTPRTPADLADHDGVLLVGRNGRQDVWTLAGPKGPIDVRMQGRFESNLGEVLRDAALAGLGIALHSYWHVSDDLRDGRLVVVLPGFPVAETAIWAVMPQRRMVPPRVTAFVDFLAAEFAQPPWDRPLAK